MRSTLPFVAFVLLATAPALAQQSDALTQIDKIFGWVTPGSPGCAAAASRDGVIVVNRAYGLANLDEKTPITPDTLFDAGSVVKQFVAAATLLLVEDGRLSLTEDVRTYLPELPDPGHRITLDHLLTHTSGVRDWTGLRPLASDDPDALTLTLRQRGLNFPPGDEWAYSNGGYVLLKEIVARTTGMSFADVARTRLFEPLGLRSTRYVVDTSDLNPAPALAYEKRGNEWRLDVLVDNARGGGGALFTTALDLVRWNDALKAGRLGAFVTRKMQEPATLNNGRKIGYARGLFLDQEDGSTIIWHTGSAAGYKSLVARFPDAGVSAAIVCNAGDSPGRMAFAQRVVDLFGSPAVARPDPPPAEADVAGVDVSGRAGLFFNEETGESLRLVVNGGRLRVQGGPLLAAVSADRFRNPGGDLEFMSGDRFELSFPSPDVFVLRSMEGTTTTYRRAEAWTPAAAELEEFAGRYKSDEAGAVFRIAAGEKGLTLQVEHAPERRVVIAPIARDVFQIARMILRFERDDAGAVVAIRYTNPVVRDIRFERLAGERP